MIDVPATTNAHIRRRRFVGLIGPAIPAIATVGTEMVAGEAEPSGEDETLRKELLKIAGIKGAVVNGKKMTVWTMEGDELRFRELSDREFVVEDGDKTFTIKVNQDSTKLLIELE